MTNNRSAVLYRASNILAMDYPYREAIESALCFADEAVIVCDTRSTDGTPSAVADMAADNPGRIIPVYFDFIFDRLWQEKAWAAAAANTSADWHIWLDLDELIHEDNHVELRALMGDPGVHLINLPWWHFYGTPRWRLDGAEPRANTRFGRVSQGYKMVNMCTDQNPQYTCVYVEYNGADAHFVSNEHMRRVQHAPIMHYGWVRSSRSLAISRAKQKDWYADGEKYADGRIPVVSDFNFDMAAKVESKAIIAYDGPHPAHVQPWLDLHETEWRELDNQARET